MREGDFMQQYARAKSTGGKVRRLKIHRTSLRAQNSGEARCMEFRDQYEAYPSKGFLTVTSRAERGKDLSDVTIQRRFFRHHYASSMRVFGVHKETL